MHFFGWGICFQWQITEPMLSSTINGSYSDWVFLKESVLYDGLNILSEVDEAVW